MSIIMDARAQTWATGIPDLRPRTALDAGSRPLGFYDTYVAAMPAQLWAAFSAVTAGSWVPLDVITPRQFHRLPRDLDG